MSVIEHPWHVDESGTIIRDSRGYRIAETIELDIPPQEFGNAKLIAQAPAMARLLLSLEYTTPDVDDPYPGARCPHCGGFEQPGGSGHYPKCELRDVLRAAGVIE